MKSVIRPTPNVLEALFLIGNKLSFMTLSLQKRTPRTVKIQHMP